MWWDLTMYPSSTYCIKFVIVRFYVHFALSGHLVQLIHLYLHSSAHGETLKCLLYDIAERMVL
jgi:hypothetical protein